MLIDWFTVAAQLINFVVLVWLLKRLLYKPMLDAIDARERTVNGRLDKAQATQHEAQAQLEHYQHQQSELEQHRDELLRQASTDAATERERLLTQARAEAKALRAQQDTALRHDMERLHEDIAQRTQQEVLAMARKALAALADADVEALIVDRFITHLKNLPAEPRLQLQQQMHGAQQTAFISSAWSLQPEQQARVRSCLLQTLSIADVQFKVSPEVIGGIELTTDGHKLSWNLSSFVGRLEDRLLQPMDLPGMQAPAG